MKDKTLYTLWAALFILCVLLGFIPASSGLGKAALCLIGICFFVPGAVLLYRAIKSGDQAAVCRLRHISLVSLGATCVMLTLNFLCVGASAAVGNLLYALLVIVSSPMACTQYWVISLFLWACLLSASFTKPVKAAG